MAKRGCVLAYIVLTSTMVAPHADAPAEAATATALYSFRGGSDGAFPYAGVVLDASGALYGTTFDGGGRGCYRLGCGTIFKLTPTKSGYAESIVHRFGGPGDGAGPNGLITDRIGAFYGTTQRGGTGPCDGGCGTIFKLAQIHGRYSESVLFSFQDDAQGGSPSGALVMDASGALYGATIRGGDAAVCVMYGFYCGTVFKLTPTGSRYALSTLHTFAGGGDGAGPMGGVVFDATGDLFGTTYYGGQSASHCGSTGCGVVFELAPNGTVYEERVVHTFQGGSDVSLPSAPLAVGDSGSIFGTTEFGGTSKCSRLHENHCGVVFDVTPAGKGYETRVAHRFGDGAHDGGVPLASLVAQPGGTLVGTTFYGGSQACGDEYGPYGCGAVYALRASGTGCVERVVHTFALPTNGFYPAAALTPDGKGSFFGTATQGGYLPGCYGYGCGTVFRLKV